MGWLEKIKELDLFYFINILVIGVDIIFFWVVRMIMFGMYEFKKILFKNVFFYGIVRDEIGRKMLKFFGNFFDFFDLIKEYGVDVIRFFMIYNIF